MLTYAGVAELGAGEPWWAMVERGEWPEGLKVDLENSCLYMCPHTALDMCPHTPAYVSSYCYICGLRG